MVTGMEVGALFRLVDEVSPGLRKILESVRELNKAITAARDNLKGLGATSPGLGAAITETDSLAAAWRKVGESAAAASKLINETAAKSAAAAATATGATTATSATMSRRHRPGWLGGGGGGGGGPHVTGPGIALPGGSHLRVGGNAAMVGAGALGYGIFEDAEMQKGIHWINYHLGRRDSKENNAEVSKIIEEGMIKTGFPMHDVIEAITDNARLMKGAPGVDVPGSMPEFIRAAAAEALAKGTTMKESMKAIVGMAHMVKAYTPAEIKRLFPAFAYLSTANPASLAQMERAFSYAVPTLQSGADVDPITTMLLGTALSTAGVTNSKSGTWVRSFVSNAMPGNAKHNEMLKRFGLLDENGKPTWFTNGKPDPAKALEIAGPIAAQMPPEERLPAELSLFGTRGAGAFSVLGDQKVLARIKELRKEMDSEDFKSRYGSILEDYQGTAVQTAHTTLAEFNVTLMRLGDTVLPAATGALRDFSSVLQGIRALIPGSDDSKWRVGTRAIEGAAIGAGIGLVTPIPGGAAIGGAAGAIIGGGFGALETPSGKKWTSPGKTGRPSEMIDRPPADKMKFLQGPPITLKPQPISLSLNVDGRTLAQSMTEQLEYLTEHATGAPAYNGQSHFARADGGLMGT
jgi:hypothetical protein